MVLQFFSFFHCCKLFSRGEENRFLSFLFAIRWVNSGVVSLFWRGHTIFSRRKNFASKKIFIFWSVETYASTNFGYETGITPRWLSLDWIFATSRADLGNCVTSHSRSFSEIHGSHSFTIRSPHFFFSPELSLSEQNKNWICLFSCRHPRIRPVPIAVIKNHFSGKSLEIPSSSGFPISRDKIMPKNGCRRVFPKSATFPLPVIENMCKEWSQFKKINAKQI